MADEGILTQDRVMRYENSISDSCSRSDLGELSEDSARNSGVGKDMRIMRDSYTTRVMEIQRDLSRPDRLEPDGTEDCARIDLAAVPDYGTLENRGVCVDDSIGTDDNILERN
jgi:hypothetical protein